MRVVRAPCVEAPRIASRYRSRIPATERGLATARARPQACRSSVSSNGAQYRAARALVMIVSDEYQGRSEERRVGKECRGGWRRRPGRKKEEKEKQGGIQDGAGSVRRERR